MDNLNLQTIVGDALRRAYSLGQTYWQQADSEYVSQHKKAATTATKFGKLVDDIVAQVAARSAISPDGVPAQASAAEVVPLAWRDVVKAIRAVDAEASKRGEMFPQNSDEQRADKFCDANCCWSGHAPGCEYGEAAPATAGDLERDYNSTGDILAEITGCYDENVKLWELADRVRGMLAAAKALAAPATAAGSVPDGWHPITAPGQVKVGTKLRFTIGDDKYSETAKLILHPGTDKEEIIYNKPQNYYLITSMCMANKGSQKNVEFFAAAQSAEGGREA